MVRIEFQHRAQRGEDFIRARLGLALRCPLVPRPQVHHCFREKSANVWIVWKVSPDVAHRICIRAIQAAAVCRLRISVPFPERIDERSLDR